MTAAKKSINVCEFVPQGYNSWWEYCQTKEAKRKALKENICCLAAIIILLTAYCVVGNLEVM
jgi:hypothetical protein